MSEPSIPSGDGVAIVRSGVDVVAISRIEQLLEEFDIEFRRRVFTPAEIAYCDRQPHPAQHYAARWAATEAFRKLLDEVVAPPPLAAVGVTRAPGKPPRLELRPGAQAALRTTCRAAGVSPAAADVAVSISHDRTADLAIAQIVLLGVEA